VTIVIIFIKARAGAAFEELAQTEWRMQFLIRLVVRAAPFCALE
jgi:hypothetical protein